MLVRLATNQCRDEESTLKYLLVFKSSTLQSPVPNRVQDTQLISLPISLVFQSHHTPRGRKYYFSTHPLQYIRVQDIIIQLPRPRLTAPQVEGNVDKCEQCTYSTAQTSHLIAPRLNLPALSLLFGLSTFYTMVGQTLFDSPSCLT